MLKKIKNIVSKADRYLYQKFGSDKTTKSLENIGQAQIIISYLNEPSEDFETRFVGGCVRNAISGESIDDIDLATSLEPDEVKKKLNKKNIKLIDSGISHGTITAILDKKKFEITTLRKDVATDGRHAKVEFTLKWEQDALRRDFSINAIYADIQGRIFDPLDGITDLKNGKIKFIGEAEERIQEDYLRILRYFRFFNKYSKEEHDPHIIRSIKKYINGLNKISKERIFDEIKKILILKDIHRLFSNKVSRDIILNIFPQFKHHERLRIIIDLNSRLKAGYDKYLILALLIVDESNDYEFFCHKYKIPNNIKNRLRNISKNYGNLVNKKFYSETNIRRLIYLHGKEYVKDLLLFSLSINKKINIEKLIDFLESCDIPKFPISGHDLKKHGYEKGEAIGKKLKNLEEKWIESNFIIKKEELESSLKNISKN